MVFHVVSVYKFLLFEISYIIIEDYFAKNTNKDKGLKWVLHIRINK